MSTGGSRGGDDPFAEYVSSLERRVGDRGYSERRDGPSGYDAHVFHRRKFSLTKFGLVDYFVVVAAFEEPTPRVAREFSEAAFRYGLSNKSKLPRGLGGNLVVYPVVVAPSAPERVLDWVSSYSNKHWGSFEFPGVVDLSRGRLFYNESKPLWGRVYYRGFHEFADGCLSPRGTGSGGRNPREAGGDPNRGRTRGKRERSARRQSTGDPTPERASGGASSGGTANGGGDGERAYCRECGAEVGPDWKYCESCGTSL